MHAYRESWRLAWPLILSNLSVPLLGVVDTAVVGHLDAPHYLGAVALGAMVISVLYWLFGFLRMGTTALTAQAFGAADGVETRAALARALLLAVGVRAAGDRRRATGHVVQHAAVRAHGRRRCRSSTAISRSACSARRRRSASFALLGWLLGLQDSRRPLYLMLFTNGVNAVLCVLFVFGLGMTAAGVALATVDRRICRARRWACWSSAAPGAARAAGPAGPRLLVLERFRRLLAVNRDLFLRSLMLEAVFVAFTALSSRQGELVLAANADPADLLHRRRLRPGRLRARRRSHGRPGGRRTRSSGLSGRGAGELRQRRAAGAADDAGLRRCSAAWASA